MKEYKKVLISVFLLSIGAIIYWVFDNKILIKNNIILELFRNHIPDAIWVISFYISCTIFFKRISRRYILYTSIYVIFTAIIFEILQYVQIVKGTFDIIDIIVYIFSVLISALLNKKLNGGNNYEKN